MEYYEKYVSYLQTEGTGSAVLRKLYQDAADSLASDPPEEALTRTGQLVAALLSVAKHQELPEQSMVNAINGLTTMMAAYVEHLGWRQWAVKTEEGWIYEQLSPRS